MNGRTWALGLRIGLLIWILTPAWGSSIHIFTSALSASRLVPRSRLLRHKCAQRTTNTQEQFLCFVETLRRSARIAVVVGKIWRWLSTNEISCSQTSLSAKCANSLTKVFCSKGFYFIAPFASHNGCWLLELDLLCVCVFFLVGLSLWRGM
jgi:hypothetical protein